MMILDKQGRPRNAHERPPGWKISPYERDCIYQEFLTAFPDRSQRRAILREFRDEAVVKHARSLFLRSAKKYNISAGRIYDFVSEAVAAEAKILPKNERWDWWVGCSFDPNASKSA